MSVAPIACIGPNQLGVAVLEPPNIRCSNRWAKPVRPAGSSFEPTWYQTDSATTGALWSSWTTTFRPFWQREGRVGDRHVLDELGDRNALRQVGRQNAGEVRAVAAARMRKAAADNASAVNSPENRLA